MVRLPVLQPLLVRLFVAGGLRTEAVDREAVGGDAEVERRALVITPRLGTDLLGECVESGVDLGGVHGVGAADAGGDLTTAASCGRTPPGSAAGTSDVADELPLSSARNRSVIADGHRAP